MKTVVVDLPVGLTGNAQASPTCPQSLLAPGLEGVECPTASIVGTVAFSGSPTSWTLPTPPVSAVTPIFNVPPEHGHPAQFAFVYQGQEATLYANVVPTGTGYALRVTAPSIPRIGNLKGIQVTFF